MRTYSRIGSVARFLGGVVIALGIVMILSLTWLGALVLMDPQEALRQVGEVAK